MMNSKKETKLNSSVLLVQSQVHQMKQSLVPRNNYDQINETDVNLANAIKRIVEKTKEKGKHDQQKPKNQGEVFKQVEVKRT